MRAGLRLSDSRTECQPCRRRNGQENNRVRAVAIAVGLFSQGVCEARRGNVFFVVL